MSVKHADRVLREVEQLLTDARLLERYANAHDPAAFEALLLRHGPMVLRVCRGILRDCHDADDAFQATFLILACNAGKVRNPSSVAAFLHGTACRVALRAKARASRRRALEREVAQMRAEAIESHGDTPETALHEELAQLPERYRRAIVLCHLEGLPHAEAARALGCPVGSVSRLLHRACELLRERLEGRSMALPAGAALLTTLATGTTVPAALTEATVRVVADHVVGGGLVGGSSVPAVMLAREVLGTMNAFKLAGLAVLLLLVGLVAGGTTLFAGNGAPPETKDPPPRVAAEAPAQDPKAGFDAHGDPLPPEVIARLGTVRLRHGGQPFGLTFARDSRALLSIGGDLTLRLWQVPGGKELGRLSTEVGAMSLVALSADGKTLATASHYGDIAVHDFIPDDPPALGKERLRIKPENLATRCIAFRPDGILVAGALNGEVSLWDATGKKVRQFGKAVERVEHLHSLSPDGKRLAVGSSKGEVVLWDVDRAAALATIAGEQKVSSLAWSHDGKTLAVGDATNTIRLWDTMNHKITARLVGVKAPDQTRGHGDEIHSLAFTPDDRTLISVGDYGDGTVRLWDVQSGRERRQLRGQYGDGHLLVLSPDGKTLAVCGMNNTIRLWDVATGKALATELGSQGAVYAVAVSNDSKEVATAGSDGVIRFWNASTGKEQRSFRAHLRQIFTLAYSPTERGLLSSSGAYEPARLWDVGTGKEVRSFAGSTQFVLGVSNLCYSPDGRKVVLSANDSTLQMVDVATGKIEKIVGKGLIDRMAFSPDGKRLAAGGFDRKLHLWDLASGKELWSADVNSSIAAVAFTPDGERVAAGTYDSDIILWEPGTGREALRMKGPGGVMRTLAISPDSRLLAASGDTPVVTLVELATGQAVQRLEGHTGGIWSVAFAPNGRFLVSGSFDATALVWDLTGREVARKQRGQLSGAELESRWDALGGQSAEEGHRAILSLANVPGQALPLLRTRLAGETRQDAQAIARWIADLDSEQFKVREAASQELAALGRGIEIELRRARESTQSLEVRRRLDALLEKLGGTKGDERLRGRRVVAILELIATAEARSLLEQLSRKSASEAMRRWSTGALDRIGERK